jgi:hypothetical protein
VEEDFSTATTHDGIRLCPRGTAATDGVRSPSRHHARCRARTLVTGMSRLSDRLTSGPDSIWYFQSFSIIQTLKFKLVSFPMSKIGQILQVDSLKHGKKLYFLDQLQNPIGLQVINSGTN